MNNEKDQKLKLVVLILVLILLLVLVNILKNIKYQDKIWNYSKINSALEVINEGKPISDRKLYYELENIIIRFIVSNTGTEATKKNYGVEYDTTYEDYYSILTDSYKRHLSKQEYNELVKSILDKFNAASMDLNGILQMIIMYEDNKYLCLLSNKQQFAYFGVKLNSNNNSYEIFYLE